MSKVKNRNELWKSLELLSNQHWLGREFKGRGHFEFSGHLNFVGRWTGEILGDRGDSHLIVHSGSEISGVIHCQKLSVYGAVKSGQVYCEEFRVFEGAEVNAQVWSKTMRIEEGAKYQGRLKSLEKRPIFKIE